MDGVRELRQGLKSVLRPDRAAVEALVTGEVASGQWVSPAQVAHKSVLPAQQAAEEAACPLIAGACPHSWADVLESGDLEEDALFGQLRSKYRQ